VLQKEEDKDWVKKGMQYEVEGTSPTKTLREIVEKTIRHIN